MSDVCEHGSLRRQCGTCYLHGQIVQLCHDLDSANAEIDRLTRDNERLRDRVLHLQDLEMSARNAALAADIPHPPAKLVERIIDILQGIDKTETEDDAGWWETSDGAAFGAGRLAAVLAILEKKP